jgi:hypothetical protein
MFPALPFPLLLAATAAMAQASDPSGLPPFAARTVYQAPSAIYGLAWGEFDPGHAGGEVACLLEDASVVQLSPNGLTWAAVLRHRGLTTIGGMIDRPTICIGDVHSGFADNEIVIDGGKYLTVIHPAGGWSHEILFTVGPAGAGWGSRVGNIDPIHAGDEILHSFEGVMDRGTIGLFSEAAGTWQEQIIYNEHVVMDSAVGEFDAAHAGPELVAVTEMGPAYALYPPTGTPGGYWPRRTLWDNMDEAGWVVKIADIEPDYPGNELVYGTRYSNRITMSYPAGPTSHQLEILFTGIAPPGYRTMYDIAVGDVLPDAGLEILGVDASGSVYLVRRLARGVWQGTIIWQSMTGSLHAVIAGDFLPDRPGDEVLVAGQSGTATLLMLASPADFDLDGDVDTDDFDLFQFCASGPEVPFRTGCDAKDLDRDGDVDQRDFAVFQRCYSGENNPDDPNCAD